MDEYITLRDYLTVISCSRLRIAFRDDEEKILYDADNCDGDGVPEELLDCVVYTIRPITSPDDFLILLERQEEITHDEQY